MKEYGPPAKLQCTATTQRKERCTRIATHFTGSKSLCEKHHGEYVVKRVNDVPIKRGKK